MAFGARVVGSLVSPHFPRIRRYAHDSGDGTALYIGDIVKLATSGSNFVGVGGSGETLPRVIKAAATDIAVGIVVGIDPIVGFSVGSENLARLYLPASTTGVVMVVDDPFVIFEMVGSNGTSALSDSSKKSQIAYAAGSTTTGLSGSTLDIGQINTTGTLSLQIHGFRESTDNINPLAATAIYRLGFAIHQFLPNGAGNNVGV